MKSSFMLVIGILSFSLQSCATPYVLTSSPRSTYSWEPQYMSYDDLLALSSGEIFTIVYPDDSRAHGTLLRVTADSLAWADADTGAYHVIATSQVDHLEISRHYLWYGAAAGALVFALLSVAEGAWAPDIHGISQTPDYSGRVLVLTAGMFGGLFGMMMGSSFRYEFRFH